MMAYEAIKNNFGREHLYIVEMELDYCSNTFGVPPCTATGSGDGKCFNTIESTQDIANYTSPVETGKIDIRVNAVTKKFKRITGSFIDDGFKVGHIVTTKGFFGKGNSRQNIEITAIAALEITFGNESGFTTSFIFDENREIVLDSTKIYRFCEQRSPHPIGLDAIPSLKSINLSPSQIDIKGGLGARSSASLTFQDHPHSDIGIDKYVNERTWIALERGTFWTKLRSRNPNYQFRKLRILSGYLENGEYKLENFQARHYVIGKLDVTGGEARVSAKDPLALLSQKRAQVPKPSTGQLLSPINPIDTLAVLTPAGVGNAEYATSGTLLIKSEVMTYTRSNDNLTLTRGQRNTVATSHSANDTVQQCYVNNDQVNAVVKDILVNFANIDQRFIPDATWQSEVDTFLSGLLDGIIVKPVDVSRILKELAESMPHYLWWDEIKQQINMTAVKAPPQGLNTIDENGNILSKSLKTTDQQNMRVSTVVVNFGQFDPTKRLDEPANFEQTYSRVDVDSIQKNGSNNIQVINSRWISNTNKAAALQLAALIGRRFAKTPRMIEFSLDPKDSGLWLGQNIEVLHKDMPDFTGVPLGTPFQVISAKEDREFKYKALEFNYSEELPEDEGGSDPTVDLVIFGSNQKNINLRTVFDSLFPAPTATTKAKFIVESGIVIGSSSITTEAMNTGSWPAGAIITLQNSGHVVGAGGNGGSGAANGADGSDAIVLSYDMELINNGVIGSGGGGGAGFGSGANAGGGGGGAGNIAGISSTTTTAPPVATASGLELGGNGGNAGTFKGGDGGDLGQPGEDSVTNTGGSTGIAIVKGGNILTETNLGDVRGSITA